jgi:hypothetical protein
MSLNNKACKDPGIYPLTTLFIVLCCNVTMTNMAYCGG